MMHDDRTEARRIALIQIKREVDRKMAAAWDLRGVYEREIARLWRIAYHAARQEAKR